MENVEAIYEVYSKIRDSIENRILEFKSILQQEDHLRIFKEFIFCLLTPQSKAKLCWNAVEKLFESDKIMYMDEKSVADFLHGIRFRYTKAKRIILARDTFFRERRFLLLEELKALNSFDGREFLVKNVVGYGYKEASHFLRNISLGLDLAILDRHVIRNLLKFGVIDNIPKSLTRKNYLNIEKKMREFAKKISIEISHLDFVFWYMETGEIFK